MPFCGPAPRLLIKCRLVHNLLLECFLKGDPHKIAIKEDISCSKMTYGEMYAAIREANAAMQLAGVSKGDIVLICLPDCPELLVHAVAVWQLGGTVTVINPYFSADEIEKRRNLVSAKWMITRSNWKSSCRSDYHEGDMQAVLTEVSTKTRFSLQAKMVEAAKVDVALVVTERKPDTSELVATPFTHYNVSAAIQMMGDTLVFQRRPPGQLFLVCFPLWSASGLLLSLHGLCSQYQLVVRDRLDISSLRGLLQKYKITMLTAPVETLTFLNESEISEDLLDSITVICTASNHQKVNTENSLLQKVDSAIVVYALPECLSWPFVSLEIPASKEMIPVLVAPNFECKILDPRGVECRMDVTGNVYVRGPACASTYLSGEPIADEYGWIKTGISAEYSEKDMCLFFALPSEQGNDAHAKSL
uniref:AMP-binding domain-containing protein n=1 Tax=Trichuris muris TaxID=70415 RepID=A0A5S6Q971_TRIMR